MIEKEKKVTCRWCGSELTFRLNQSSYLCLKHCMHTILVVGCHDCGKVSYYDDGLNADEGA